MIFHNMIFKASFVVKPFLAMRTDVMFKLSLVSIDMIFKELLDSSGEPTLIADQVSLAFFAFAILDMIFQVFAQNLFLAAQWARKFDFGWNVDGT